MGRLRATGQMCGDVAVIRMAASVLPADAAEDTQPLAGLLRAAAADHQVHAVVLVCDEAGADAPQNDRETLAAAEDLSAANAVLDVMTKPTVALLGSALREAGPVLALACADVVATRDASIAFGQAAAGRIPVGGTTSRLPRRVGLATAVQLVVTGRSISARQALAVGLVDQIASGDGLSEAIAMAETRAAGARPDAANPSGSVCGKGRDTSSPGAAPRLPRRRSYAGTAAMELIEACAGLPPAEAMARERATLDNLVAGQAFAARRHLLQAEHALPAAFPPGAAQAADRVRHVAVVGAGTMGTGIAICCADAGLAASVCDVSAEAVARGRALVEADYRRRVDAGELAPEDMAERLARIAFAPGLDAVETANVVVESVFEDLTLKRSLFAELDRRTRPEAVLATNTSSLDVGAIARATAHPARVVGTHFFSPAQAMRAVEVIRADTAGDTAAALIFGLLRRLGKVPVPVGVCHGFAGNRMLYARSRQVERLLLEGCSPAEIDDALTGFGFPMGPCAMADMAGLDAGWRIRQQAGTRAPVADALYEAGRLGRKTGAGFYRYAEGSRRPLPDPQVAAFIADVARRTGVARRTHAPGMVLERLILPLLNEGIRILEEGIAVDARHLDLIWVHGFAWPADLGGPMAHLDALGAAAVAGRLDALADGLADDGLRPCGLLRRLAGGGGRTADISPCRTEESKAP